jgi:Tol biopolymer transport system component
MDPGAALPVSPARPRITRVASVSLAAAVVAILLTAVAADAKRNVIRRISVSSRGRQANGNSFGPALSADGRFVAFRSKASNLVPDDTNRVQDIFVRDRRTGTTTRVSVADDDSEANADSGGAAISADGRIVAFWSNASNLVPGDTYGRTDVFVRNRIAGTTTRVSVSTTGGQANAESRQPALSGDGAIAAFRSDASNLVAHDTNETGDIFVHDRRTGETTRVSVSSRGGQPNGRSRDPALNASGRFVAFRSEASNLAPHDTNRVGDIFVHDRKTGATTRASVDSRGRGASGCGVTGCGCDPVLSADGRFVSFWSSATNLVPADTNGAWDVFVRDLRRRRTTRVSVWSGGSQGRGSSGEPWLSGNGRVVAFASRAPLTVEDVNGDWDVYIHDRRTGLTTPVTGGQAGGISTDPVLSLDGRFVAFYSYATRLVAGDTNRRADVFVLRR